MKSFTREKFFRKNLDKCVGIPHLKGHYEMEYGINWNMKIVEKERIRSILGREKLILHWNYKTTYWKDVTYWIGLKDHKVRCFKESFLEWCFFSKSKKRKSREEMKVVWLATIWNLWIVRNIIIYVVWRSKVLVWRWSFLGNIIHFSCNFNEFSKDNLIYLF